MLYRDISKILGYYFFGLSLAFLVPLYLCFYYLYLQDPILHPQPIETVPFLKSLTACILLGMGFYWYGRRSSGNLYHREGLFVVVAIWLLTPLVAGLPFFLSRTLENPYQAYFEAVSGLTATGTSVMEAKKYDPTTGKEIPIEYIERGVIDTVYEYKGTIAPVVDPDTKKPVLIGVEAVPRELLFWRSFIQFLGGGGIIVLFVAILPALGVGGKVLFQAEVSGPVKDSLTPRIKEGAKQVWKIYVGLTILQTLLLMWTNEAMPFFDALTISFATLATGGQSIKNANIGYYHNASTDWVIIIFMLLGSISFTFYYYILRGKFHRIFQAEFFLFLALILLSCFLTVWYLVGTEKVLLTGEHSGIFSLGEAVRYGTFQMVSAHTTTGFYTADFDRWPYVIQLLMLIGMFIGGMSGSTAGGLKVVRIYMLFYIAKAKIESLFRPETVRNVRVGERQIDHSAMILVLVYFLVTIAVSVLGTLFYVMDGIDPETALGLVACMLNGGGMGFRADGPVHSCAFLSDFSLILSCILMILGRLEFFAILALFVPAFWKKNG